MKRPDITKQNLFIKISRRTLSERVYSAAAWTAAAGADTTRAASDAAVTAAEE